MVKGQFKDEFLRIIRRFLDAFILLVSVLKPENLGNLAFYFIPKEIEHTADQMQKGIVCKMHFVGMNYSI